jgi:hypothetical protein
MKKSKKNDKFESKYRKNHRYRRFSFWLHEISVCKIKNRRQHRNVEFCKRYSHLYVIKKNRNQLWKIMSSDFESSWMSKRKCSQIWWFKIRNNSFRVEKRNVNEHDHFIKRNDAKISTKRQIIRNLHRQKTHI